MAGFRDRFAQAAAGRQAANTQAVHIQQQLLRLEQQRIRAAEDLGRIQDQNSREARRAADYLQHSINRERQARENLQDAQERSMTTMQRGFRDAAAAGAASVSNIATQVLNETVKVASRARQALIQNFRGLGSELSVSDYGTAFAGYERMIVSAGVTAVRYGHSLEDVTAAQHEFIQAMNVDVSRSGFHESVSRMTDTMAYLASRTGQSIGEINDFSRATMEMFGRGTTADIDAYERSLRNMAQLPGLLREEVAASMGKDVADLGAMFSNPQELRMIEQWTTEFGDQAANIQEMYMSMRRFSAEAAKSGHSIRTMNNMRNAIVTGTQGIRGHNANTLLAGRQLQQRISADPAMLQRYADQLRAQGREGDIPADLDIIRSLASGDSGLNASDLFHMMKGTAEGMDSYMESLVGMGSGNLSVTKSMLEQQGIDTGNDRDNLRLAHLITQMGQGEVVDTDEVSELLTRADDRETRESENRAQQYTNIAIASEGIQKLVGIAELILAAVGGRVARNAGNLARNVMAGTGVTAALARQFPALARFLPQSGAAAAQATTQAAQGGTRVLSGARGLARGLPMLGAAIGAYQSGRAWLDPSVSSEDASAITGSAITDLAWPIAIANAIGGATGVGTTEDLFRGLQEGAFVQSDERDHIVMPYENEDGSMLDEDWRRMLYGRDNTFFGIDMSTPTEEPVTVPPQQQNQAAPANQGTAVPANGQSSALVPAGATLQANGDAVLRLELRAEHFNDLIRQVNFQNSRNAPVGNVVNSIV